MASELNQIASWALRWRICMSGVLCLVAALLSAQPDDPNEGACAAPACETPQETSASSAPSVMPITCSSLSVSTGLNSTGTPDSRTR